MANPSETAPGVYVLGIDKAENTGPIYEALRAAGYAWRGQALSLPEALRQLAIVQQEVNLVVVRAELARRGEEAALLESLARLPVVVLLGAARADRQAAIAQLPNVRAVIVVPPYDFRGLGDLPLEKLAPARSPVSPTVSPPAATPDRPTSVVRPMSRDPLAANEGPTPAAAPPALTASVARALVTRTRLAFYGIRGGVGTSTAALQAAKLLASQGTRVALLDVRQRGDLHVMLGCEPTAQPLHHDLITVYLSEPTEEIAAQHEAIMIDGGRQRGVFNAQWIEVYRPLEENALRRLIGLPPIDQSGVTQPARRLNLSKIFSIEVTE